MNFSTFKQLTRIEHTLFALPFMLGGAALALSDVDFSARTFWILPAFLLARVSGMAFNQLIDRHIDAINPRTQNRALPTGRATVKQARIIAWSTLCLFLIICSQLNTLTALLSILAASLIYIYSYMKRVHFVCHFVLGSIHFLAPVMACAVITGSVSLPVIFLGAASCLLITGGDIVYAIQDCEFDRKMALYSLPSRFGIKNSLTIAAVLHGCCILMLVGVGIAAHFFPFYYALIPLATFIFYIFHQVFRHQLKNGLETSFFRCTVSISFLTLFFVLSGVVWDVLS